MKLSDCGMALEEQPGKVAEALRLFINGLGYSLTAYERRRSSLRKLSLSSLEGINGNASRKSSLLSEVSLKAEMPIAEGSVAHC
jgi:misexpression suppressor of KSR, putative